MVTRSLHADSMDIMKCMWPNWPYSATQEQMWISIIGLKLCHVLLLFQNYYFKQDIATIDEGFETGDDNHVVYKLKQSICWLKWVS